MSDKNNNYTANTPPKFTLLGNILSTFVGIACLCFYIISTPSLAASEFKNNKAPHLTGKHDKIDMGIINQQKALYWLKKHNKIREDASNEKQAEALDQFIKKAQNRSKATKLSNKIKNKKKHKHKHSEKHQSDINELTTNSPSATSSTRASASASEFASSIQTLIAETNDEFLSDKNSELSVQKISSVTLTNTHNTTVKVLAVMIDFPDLPFDDNGLDHLDTEMYYSNYSSAHYTDLLFSTTGFSGPYGENLLSVYQYYQQESGESLHFTGEVFGWVSADENAAYYGANNEINENDVNVDDLVIEAITKAVARYNINLSEFDNSDFFDIDNDGITNEPDGIVDHIVIFHSSIGEEAGGGELGDSAIWSHRFFVFNNDDQPISIPGSNTKIYGYTINAIDATTGVVAHEFGHDLGLRDEYDLTNPSISGAVSNWSIMDSGAWLYQGTEPSGSSPSSFSPAAKDYLQTTYNGNWLKQYELDFVDVLQENVDLVAANNHQGDINQVKVNLPPDVIFFGEPMTGNYQFYSDKGPDLSNSLSFSTHVSSNSTLSMQANWQIEDDYDFVQIKVNDIAIEGNYTQRYNPQYQNVEHYISGSSQSLDGINAFDKVTLSFDLSEFANQTISVSITYITDSEDNKLGIAIDDITITDGSNNITFEHGAETEENISLNGFSRINNSITTDEHNYYIQLRDLSGSNKSLSTGEINYEPGILVWYHNQAFDDNNVTEHPGQGFIGVVDADQNPLTIGKNILDVSMQLRDASFSLFNQNSFFYDTNLNNSAIFSDINDYSSPYQTETGLTLPLLGFSSEVIYQSGNSDSATIKLEARNTPHISIEQHGLTIKSTLNDILNENITNINWLFDSGNIEQESSVSSDQSSVSLTHQYTSAGEYSIKVSYESDAGFHTLSLPVTVGEAVNAELQLTTNNLTLDYSAVVYGGYGDLSYHWDFSNQLSSTLSQGQITYSSANIYDVVLTIIDETSTAYIFTETIDMSAPLTADIEESINELNVSFSSNINGGVAPYTYSWRFGDDMTSTEFSPAHRYGNTGTYTVRLLITDALSNSITITKEITVKAANKSSGGSMTLISLLSLLILLTARRHQCKNPTKTTSPL